MTKKKQSTASIAAAAARAAVEAASDETEVLVAEDPEEEQEFDALGSLAALGADHEGVRYIVKCLSPLDRKGTIEEVSREELPELVFILRDRYGPGKYSVSAFGPRGYVKGSHRVITISSLVARSQVPAATSSLSSDAERRATEQEARFERQRLEQREDRKFMLELLVGALPVLQGMLRPPSLADQAAAMTAIGALKGGGDNTEKILETLVKGMELGKEINGGGGSDSWPGLIREVVKDLTPGANSLLTQIAERRAAAAAAQGSAAPRALPAPAVPKILDQLPSAPASGACAPGASAGADHPEVKDPMLRAQLPLLDKLADELLEFAANGADPGLCAEAMVAKIPRAVRAFLDPKQLITWLQHPEWWTVLEAFRPQLKPYQGYCDDVRQTLLKLMTEAESDPENP